MHAFQAIQKGVHSNKTNIFTPCSVCGVWGKNGIVSAIKIEIKDRNKKIHEIKKSKIVWTLKHMEIPTILIYNYLDETCQIRQGSGKWYPLVKVIRQDIIKSNGDVRAATEMYDLKLQQDKEHAARIQNEADISAHQRKIEADDLLLKQTQAESLIRQQIQQEALQHTLQLKGRCIDGTWSWADVQYIAGLLSAHSTHSSTDDCDPLKQVKNELMNYAIRNSGLIEAIKVVYAKNQSDVSLTSLNDPPKKNNIDDINSNSKKRNEPIISNDLDLDVKTLRNHGNGEDTYSDVSLRVANACEESSDSSNPGDTDPLQKSTLTDTGKPATHNKFISYSITAVILLPIYVFFMDKGPIIFVPLCLLAWAIGFKISEKIQKSR